MSVATDHLERTDQELAEAALSGDPWAFNSLVCRYQDAVVNVVYRMYGDPQLAEDAAQDAFLKAWQRLETYQPKYAFRNWLIGIAAHGALDRLRRERPALDVDELPLPAEGGLEQDLERSQQVARVRQAVLALPEAARAVLVLREYEGLAYADIAQALQIPLGTVMSRLNYARKLLRQSLAPDLEEL